MRFEPHPDGEEAFAAVLGPGHPGVRLLKASAGDWNFVIMLDLLHSIWSATYQVRRPVPGKRYTSQQCEPAPPGQKFKHYDSQAEAEKACERKYRELRANN